MCSLFFDGSSNSNGIGFGYIIKNDKDEIIGQGTKKLEHRDLTSNSAEYMGLVTGLLKCVELNIKEVKVFGDSQLIIKQVLGEYKVKSAHLKSYHLIVHELIPLFDEINFNWISRKDNKEADRISR